MKRLFLLILCAVNFGMQTTRAQSVLSDISELCTNKHLVVGASLSFLDIVIAEDSLDPLNRCVLEMGLEWLLTKDERYDLSEFVKSLVGHALGRTAGRALKNAYRKYNSSDEGRHKEPSLYGRAA